MSNKTIVIGTRLEPQQVKVLERLAKSQGITKSDLMRIFAVNAQSLYTFLYQSELKGAKLNGQLSQWIIDHIPPGATLETLQLVAASMNHAVDLVQQGLQAKVKGAGDEPQP
jgi:hypothetical protein